MSGLKLSVLITAIDKFSAPAQKIAGVSEEMAARLHDGQQALQALGRKGQAVQRMQALETRLGRSAAEMDKATGRTAALGRELAATTTPTRKLQGAFETARRKSDALKRQHKQQRDELRQLRRALRGAGIDTRKLGDAQRQTAAGRCLHTHNGPAHGQQHGCRPYRWRSGQRRRNRSRPRPRMVTGHGRYALRRSRQRPP